MTESGRDYRRMTYIEGNVVRRMDAMPDNWEQDRQQRREREEREERENRRRFNNVNDDWNYPNRYGERGGGGYNGGGR